MSRESCTISRRTVMRGVGASLALPLLDAMGPRTGVASALADADSARPPVRMACLFFPNGVWMPSWIPQKPGDQFDLPFSLKPLDPLKQHVNILSGLDKRNSHEGDGHYAKTANFLTGMHVHKTTGKGINVGSVSVDQLAAQRVGHLTPLPSLELGIEPVISGIDSNVGYTRLYGSYISWRAENVPMAREINPRLVYERLFGMQPGKTAASRRKVDDAKSLLDLVLADANDLRGRLGRDDQFKMDEYLDSVRAVEKRIDFATKPDPRAWKPTTKPTAEQMTPPAPDIPDNHPEHVRLMLDLMVLAFQTDSTRIGTFMFGNSVSGRNFRGIIDGVRGGHHEISHHKNEQHNIDQYQLINRWHVEQLAYMLDRMSKVREGESTLLDNSMILMGSGMSDGNAHDPANLPILLAGGAGGAFKTGRHLANPGGTPLCNVYVSMLGRMGTPVERFGDSTGPLKSLDA
ncbi:MAG: DUF1552 domain-containing protein [Phycisphaera sp.]|nr:DUF1552 domain-containing protein [Phycisphaera sp.]